VSDYRKLEVYHEARALAREIFRMTSQLPPYLRWRLGAQLDDAAELIGANLAEGCGRKNFGHGNTELIRYGHISFGSACEVEHRLQGLNDRELLSDAEHAPLHARINRIKGMLLNLIRSWKRTTEGSAWTRSNRR
jgi:four helix bundle protein